MGQKKLKIKIMSRSEILDYFRTFCNLIAYDASVSGESETITGLNSLLEKYEEIKLKYSYDNPFFSEIRDITKEGLDNIRDHVENKDSDLYSLVMEFEDELHKK